MVDGRRAFTHERLRKARPSLSQLASEGTAFTHLDPVLTEAGPFRAREPPHVARPRTRMLYSARPSAGCGPHARTPPRRDKAAMRF